MAVHLGFPKRSVKLEISQVPMGKIGGEPLWLIPNPNLQCCNQSPSFICQIFAPGDHDYNYYRYLYLFQCTSCKTCSVYRAQTSKANELIQEIEETKAPNQEIDDWNTETNTEDIISLLEKKEQKEILEDFSIEIFEEDTKVTEVINKLYTLNTKDDVVVSDFYEQMEGGVESASEEKISNSIEDDDADEEDFDELEQENKTNRDVSFDALRWFSNFHNKTPVVRYGKDALPMWYSDKERPQIVESVCPCGSLRKFEFQVLASILNYVGNPDVEFGTLIVYSCPKACDSGNFVQEDVFFQPSQ